MKRFFAVLITSVFMLSTAVLYSQEVVTDEKTKEKITEKSEEKTKRHTKAFEQGGVVVRGEKAATIDMATTQTVVTENDIEAHNDKTLNNTLQIVPGFQTYQHGKGHIRFRMRGFEMPYVAILVDGIPLADVYEANLDISKIPVMNASEIIINRGTCSALYGTTGTIGSINIISKKPVDLYLKSSAEYGTNGDYTINAAHGNAADGFYYWLTANVENQAPFEVSKKLTKAKRQEWYDRFFPNVGYTNTTSTANNTYINDTGEWPHQEMLKYNIAGKTGYEISNKIEAGISASYTKSEAKRYSNSINNTEQHTYNTTTHLWYWKEPTASSPYALGSGAFNWRDVYTVNVSPYVSYNNGDLKIKANTFYIYTDEDLDGYQDADETVAVKGWGGAHSNWQNTSAGFNIFPSYKIAEWNKLNASVLYRWDKHLERQQADEQYASSPQGVYTNSYNFAGYDWFDTKLMTGRQFTVAIEDDINLEKLTDIPVNISTGISYDAQSLDNYKKRATAGTTYGDFLEQYIAEDDSVIWGTRDSFNPVVGLTYEPLKDFLLLRSSYSRKTKFPTMSQYANITDATIDTGLKTEKSYNTNAGIELFFFDKMASFRTDYFFTRFRDKMATVYNTDTYQKTYTNIDGEDHQGVETIIKSTFNQVLGIMSVDTGFSYTYLRVRNLDTDSQDSDVYKGKKLTDIPEHQVTGDIRFNFISKTSLNLFGSYTANAIKYAMTDNPATTDEYSTSYYKEVKLHNPVMINVTISQIFREKFELFAMCKNIMDDYDADPFNPGPGRQFSFGAKAEL